MPPCLHEMALRGSIGLILRRDLPRSAADGSAARQEAGSEQANHGACSRYFWEVIASRIPDPTFWPGAHDRLDQVIGISRNG